MESSQAATTKPKKKIRINDEVSSITTGDEERKSKDRFGYMDFELE